MEATSYVGPRDECVMTATPPFVKCETVLEFSNAPIVTKQLSVFDTTGVFVVLSRP